MPSIEQIDVDKVLVGLKHAAATAANEEELRVKASGTLENEVISKLGITPRRYEYTFVSGGRPDALYDHVIIEYKAPGKLLREPDVARAKEQLIIALFNDWKRLFSQVCAYSPEKLEGLEAEYGLSGKVDYGALLFAVHTYYALVMKLLAAEVAYLFGAGKWLKSYVAELEDANMKGLDAFKRALEDLESGGVFRKFLNITNFIESDYFSWYLEELDQDTANRIADLAKKLADYEPATPLLEPEYTRDLLKRLYQN